jgi:hypothetical protein
LKYSLFGIWLTVLLLSNVSFSQSNCDLKKETDGIKVYLCDSEVSKFKTIIAELDVPATLSQYAAKVLNVDKYHEWQYKAVDPRLVGQISDMELYYYSEVQTPWPTSNRDMIWHMKMTQDATTKVLVVELIEMPDHLPEVDDVIRIPKAHSILTVTPIDETNVRVHYIIDVDPGGEIPAWITNMFAAQAPWQTYNSFREQIITQGEDRITVPFIEDF